MKKILSISILTLLLLVTFTLLLNVSADDTAEDTVVLTPSSRAAPADAWPMFRGDMQRTGNATENGPAEYNLMWFHRKSSYGSPVVEYDQIYQLGSDRVECFDMDGRILWSYFTGCQHWNTPLVTGGRLYVAGQGGQLFCLDANVTSPNSTTCYWTYNVTGTISHSSCLKVGPLIYLGWHSNPGLRAIWASNGTLKWGYNLDGSTYVTSSPAYWNGNIYIGAGDSYSRGSNYLYCINATTGVLDWKFGTGDSVCSSPAIEYGRVYFGCNDRKIYCVDAIGNGDGTTDKLWEHNTVSKVYASAAVGYGRVYIGDSGGWFYCVSAFGSTGSTSEYWRKQITPAGSYGISDSAAISPDYIYVGTCGDLICCMWRSNGTYVWREQFESAAPYGFSASPAIIDGELFVSTDSGYFIGVGPDRLPPRVVDHMPRRDEENVTIDSEVNVTFHENMNASSFNMSTFIVTSAQGQVSGTYSYDPVLFEARFTPDADLDKGVEYKVTLTTGIMDDDDNPLDGNGNTYMEAPLIDQFTWNFTTKSTSPPVITPFGPLRPLEETEYRFDLTIVISDEDTPFDDLIITENTTYGNLDGDELVLLYPEGVHYDLINITVADNDQMVWFPVPVEVQLVNDPPTIDYLPTIYPDEDVDYVLDLSDKIHDADDPVLTLNINSTYATIDGYNITFNYPEGILSEDLNVSVSDGKAMDHTYLQVRVDPVNDPPSITDINLITDRWVNLTVKEGQQYELSFNYTDIDGPEGYFSLDAPTFMFLRSASQEIVIAPAANHIGVWDANLTVSDGRLEDTVRLTITVLNVNLPPVAGSIRVVSGGVENLTVVLNISGSSDPDDDPLTYRWNFGVGGSKLGGMQIETTYETEGIYNVTVRVMDSEFYDLAWLLINVTAPPVIPDENQTWDDNPNWTIDPGNGTGGNGSGNQTGTDGVEDPQTAANTATAHWWIIVLFICIGIAFLLAIIIVLTVIVKTRPEWEYPEPEPPEELDKIDSNLWEVEDEEEEDDSWMDEDFDDEMDEEEPEDEFDFDGDDLDNGEY